MAEINFHTLSDNDKLAVFQQISNLSRLPLFAVEKDWWVVQALSCVFELEDSKHLVFKGLPS
jgi:hypothetical protein